MLFLDAFLKGLKPQFDDDAVDRLNYYYTPLLFVIFALTLSAKQFVFILNILQSYLIVKRNLKFYN